MIITRKWEMPNSKTFRIKVIRDLILEYAKKGMLILDPFANEHSIKEYLSDTEYISNDLDKEYGCDYSLDANEFLAKFEDCSVDLVLFDPPYSPRQVKEVYTKLEKTVTLQDVQQTYWSKFKESISRVLKVGGVCISFGWHSNGIGMNNGMDIIEILLVAHGGNKNDTIATVERKETHQFRMDI